MACLLLCIKSKGYVKDHLIFYGKNHRFNEICPLDKSGGLMDINQRTTHSLWQDRFEFPLQNLHQDLTTDVCVVGAGISGLTTAFMLLKEGRKVVVLDKDGFAANESGYSSAHLSNALDEGYVEIERLHGKLGSQLAYQSHTEAINKISQIIQDENIACNFQHLDGFLFCGPDQSFADLEKELFAAARAGMKDIQLERNGSFSLGPYLRFRNQAQFNPVKYLKGLAAAIHRMGGQIYTQALVTQVKGGADALVVTQKGHVVHCKDIVVTTNVPMNDVVAIHTKEAAYRSYMIGLKINRDQFPMGLFWDTAKPYHYVRVHRDQDSDYDVLLVGGEDHKTGQQNDPQECFAQLNRWVKEKFGIDARIDYRWSGQIIEPVDGLAYIGLNPGLNNNVFIASGDSGHGITHGTIAGILLTDLIVGRRNEWEKLYSPTRINFKGLNNYLNENLNTFWQYTDWVAASEIKSADDLHEGQGAVIREGLSQWATYRDTHGKLHVFSAACPHLGGVVHWNAVEKTWDCPCHGSRFSKLGEVINGPACQKLSAQPEVAHPDLIPNLSPQLNILGPV
jgi:glycine/D-amino acid oxidase-like deaminating enzyme/nitrite reductase/ring-hydroxylating ferredoxin subunit